MSVAAISLRIRVAEGIRETRLALSWSQADLARRARVSQSTICRIEAGSIERLTFETAARVLDALGIRVAIELRAPFIADRRRQRDAGHARCLAYVARRVERLGWIVRTEVEVVTGSARGWIDILAYRPADSALLLIEVKTELPDVGAVMRQHGWYERAAWPAARGVGWRPRRLLGALLVLASAPNIQTMHANRDLLRRNFPLHAGELAAFVAATGEVAAGGKSGAAMIDPYERSRRWLMRTPLHGRSVAPRYESYAGLMARVRMSAGRRHQSRS